MENKVAIMDMGTNTFHLLLAEANDNGYHITRRDRLAVKIGMGGINHGYITEEAIHRALVAMQSFKNTIEQYGATNVYAFGTSALRNASNGQAIAERIKALTGISVDIISGDREAEYIYNGVKTALHLEQNKSLIIDIGGGSVEFIIGDNDQIFWKQSIEIGAQRLMEKFQKNDPITTEEMTHLDNHFNITLAPVFEALAKFPTNILVGSSGTFDTLSDIFCERHHIQKSAEEIETPLTIEGFYQIFQELLHKNRAERMKIPGMIEMRVDMIVVACCLIRYLLEHHPFNRIRVSTYSLKEGVLATLIHELKAKA
ncbi:Ppx/GppA phosphatase family protein [Pseudochryseolinea flava]|uniref:Exopolyphosphatase n=1 Tax=Pseudochryseolinea flava TaxID=2059302 RepID=A0A364XVD3_9BACT|nr:exopolyphosphatase [Pseudochryseolinea flava]RAV97662.1 exopolyphosphatase [Pseudochryseolinea flava]